MRGFLLDLNRCTGCHACLLACSVENDLMFGQSWREVYTFNTSRYPGLGRFHLSLGCLHCAEPACMKGCPANAYARDTATGVVLVEPGLCIGCRYCSWACPYGAPKYDAEAGTVSKCTLCNERLSNGKDPACATLCPTGALQFVEMEGGPETTAVPGFPVTSAVPRIRFVPLRSGNGPEVASETLAPGPLPRTGEPAQPQPSKATIESEWSLIAFTIAACLLVAIVGAAAAGSLSIGGLDLLLAAIGALGIGSLHLGRKGRAWRSVFNVRSSWLSREIVAYSAFVLLAIAALAMPNPIGVLSWATVLSGFFALYCVDRVYGSIALPGYPRIHSAAATLTGLYLCGVIAGIPWVAGLAGFLKLALYAERQPWTQGTGRMLAAFPRLILGFVLPLAFWSAYPDWVLPLVVVAEVIDRCEYYLDLNFASPGGQIAAEFKRAAAAVQIRATEAGAPPQETVS